MTNFDTVESFDNLDNHSIVKIFVLMCLIFNLFSDKIISLTFLGFSLTFTTLPLVDLISPSAILFRTNSPAL